MLILVKDRKAEVPDGLWKKMKGRRPSLTFVSNGIGPEIFAKSKRLGQIQKKLNRHHGFWYVAAHCHDSAYTLGASPLDRYIADLRFGQNSYTVARWDKCSRPRSALFGVVSWLGVALFGAPAFYG